MRPDRYSSFHRLDSWTYEGRSYRRDLLTYTEDWSPELAHVTTDVAMWHGTADTWAPLAMADGISTGLSKAPHLHQAPTGHYTTLVSSAYEVLDACRGRG